MLLVLYSCKGSTPKTIPLTPVFNPTSPDGNGSANRIPGVLNLVATLNPTDNKVVLTWKVPSTYVNQNYEIYIYRILGDGVSSVLDDPAIPYSIADYYFPTSTFQPITGELFADSTVLNSSNSYTYYVYIKNGDNWSSESKTTVVVGSTISPDLLPTAANFWPSYKQTIANPPYSPGLIADTTLSPGLATSLHPTGGCAFAFDGGVMYCADTENNRVVIYQTGAYQNCDKASLEPLGIYDLCLSLYKGYPFIAMAVLGQKDMYSKTSCQNGSLPANSCFTKPSGVMVADGKLVVSDTGNNRVMIHSTLPINGCFNVLELSGQGMTHQCSFSGVVGKKSLSDLSNYALEDKGDSILDTPTGLAYMPGANINEGDLYIADTGNNRVVVARKAFNSSFWKCSPDTWDTNLCKFDGLLGQSDYFSNKSFSKEYNITRNYSYDTFEHNVTVKNGDEFISDNGFFLSHYFASPNRIIINGDNLLISSNENFEDSSTIPSIALYSRIVVYNENPLAGVSPACTLEEFSLVDSKCAFDYAIGQTNPRNLIELNVSQNESYKDVNYSLTDVDFTVNGSNIFGIDRKLNRVYVWSNYNSTYDTSTNIANYSGTPYDFYVSNPAGVGENLNNKTLPNLMNLNDIVFEQNSGNLYIQDSQLGHIFVIPILQ